MNRNENTLATLAAQAQTLMAQRPVLQRGTRNAAAVAAARGEALEAKLEAARVALDLADKQGEWEHARMSHTLDLMASRNQARRALESELRDALGKRGTRTREAYRAERDAFRSPRVDALRATLETTRAQIGRVYERAITAADLRDGARLYRRVTFGNMTVGMTAADAADIVSSAVEKALLDIKNGTRAPAVGTTNVPTIGHVGSKLVWAYRAELDAFRKARRQGMTRVTSLDALAELASVDSEGEHSLQHYGYAMADLSDSFDAGALLTLGDARSNVIRAIGALTVATALGDSTGIARAQHALSSAETAERAALTTVARERRQGERHAEREARLTAFTAALMPCLSDAERTARAVLDRAVLGVRGLVAGGTLDEVAAWFAIAPETLSADMRRVLAVAGLGTPTGVTEPDGPLNPVTVMPSLAARTAEWAERVAARRGGTVPILHPAMAASALSA